jgi:hypothetical protein
MQSEEESCRFSHKQISKRHTMPICALESSGMRKLSPAPEWMGDDQDGFFLIQLKIITEQRKAHGGESQEQQTPSPDCN